MNDEITPDEPGEELTATTNPIPIQHDSAPIEAVQELAVSTNQDDQTLVIGADSHHPAVESHPDPAAPANPFEALLSSPSVVSVTPVTGALGHIHPNEQLAMNEPELTVGQARRLLRRERRQARKRIRLARREAERAAKLSADAAVGKAKSDAERSEAIAKERLAEVEKSTSLSRAQKREERARIDAEAKEQAKEHKRELAAARIKANAEKQEQARAEALAKQQRRASAKATAAADRANVKSAKMQLADTERKSKAHKEAAKKATKPERLETKARPVKVKTVKLSRARKREIDLIERNQELLKVSALGAGEMPAFGPPKYSLRWFFPSRPSKADVAMSLRMLAYLITKLKGELEPVIRQSENHAGTYLGDMYSRVAWRMSRENMSFTQAFEPETAVPDLVKSFMAVGAKGTNLPKRIQEACDLLVESESSSKDLIFSLLEPFATAIASLAMLVWISASVVPTQAAQYKSMNMDVPPVTAATIVIGQVIVWTAGIVVFLAIAAAVWWFGFGKKSSSAAEMIARAKLSIPLYGPILRISQGYTSSLFISALLRSGRTELVSLQETAKVASNRSTRAQLYAVAENLGDGATTMADVADGVHMPRVQRYVLSASITGGNLLEGFEAVRDQLKADYEFTSKRFRFAVTSIGTAVSLGIYVSAMLLMVLPTFEQATAFTNLL